MWWVGRPADSRAMTLTDWILDIALLGIVLLQLRSRRLTVLSVLLPVAIVGWAAWRYLTGIPTTGNDLVLVIGGAVVGWRSASASAR
jgi:hypothetical protein